MSILQIQQNKPTNSKSYDIIIHSIEEMYVVEKRKERNDHRPPRKFNHTFAWNISIAG